MKATCDSKELYFPMMLGNGSDGVLVDYSGSMFSGTPGHGHCEQYQGCALGWYKIGHVDAKHTSVQPIIRSSYMILVNGEGWDISDYEQVFDPASAILKTRVTAGGVVCEIESFLTDDHVLVERYKIVRTPTDDVQMVFNAFPANSGMSVFIDYREEPKIQWRFKRNQGFEFKYELKGHHGLGAMFSDRRPDGTYDCFGGGGRVLF